MKVTAIELFNAALERYLVLRSTIGATPGITFHESQGGGQEIVGIPPVEFCADFDKAAETALRRWPARAPFFYLHYISGVPVDKAARELGLNPLTAWNWKPRLANCVGHELRRRGGRLHVKYDVFYFSRHGRRQEGR